MLQIYAVLCKIVRMKKSLTSKQKIILATITDLTNKKGSAPTFEEVREELGYANTSSVQRHTDALKKKEYLSETRGLSIKSSNNKVQIPLVGNVACGAPLLATENIEAYLYVDSDMVSHKPDDYFFLRAVGDSMNTSNISGKNIDDGDYVLVRKQNSANKGNRVVALIGDEATIKKYKPNGNSIVLEPESSNEANKPIIMFEDFTIQGVVVNIIKKGGD